MCMVKRWQKKDDWEWMGAHWIGTDNKSELTLALVIGRKWMRTQLKNKYEERGREKPRKMWMNGWNRWGPQKERGEKFKQQKSMYKHWNLEQSREV